MKTLITISLFFFQTLLFGQFAHPADYFNAVPFPEILDTGNYSADIVYDFENADPKVYNVHFYGLELTTEPYTLSDAVTEERSLEVIAALNIAFNPYKIFFKYRGFSHYSEIYEEDENWPEDDAYDGDELMNINNHIVMMKRMHEIVELHGNDDKINIVLHHNSCTNDTGSANIYKKILSLRYCTSANFRVIYQMGHLFGLHKTQRGKSSVFDTIPQDPACNETSFPDELVIPSSGSTVAGDPENVTRDVSNPYFNANIAGDMVVDTPACFGGSEYNYCHLFNGNSTYEYLAHPDIVDDSPEQLMYVDVDITNFMCGAYDANGGIKDHFTDGQGVRMRETTEISSLDFAEVETTVASLFEPYKEVFDPDCNFNNEILDNYFSELPDEDPRNIDLESGLTYRSVDPDIPRGCIVSYFQPGFDYEVYWCHPINIQGDWVVGDLYCVYDKYSYIIPIISIGAKVIKIVQLDQYGECNHPCLDNIRAVGGSIYTHGNTTYEAEPLDSIQINNANFLFSLPNGIHTIKVQTNEDEIIEKTIIKQ